MRRSDIMLPIVPSHPCRRRWDAPRQTDRASYTNGPAFAPPRSAILTVASAGSPLPSPGHADLFYEPPASHRGFGAFLPPIGSVTQGSIGTMRSKAQDEDVAVSDDVVQDLDLFDTVLLGAAFLTILAIVILAATH